MYFPSPEIAHRYETMTISTDDQSLEIVVLNRGESKAILYFGGNGESVVANAPRYTEIFAMQTVYLVNYRGYGGSTGNPTEKTIYADAQLLYDKVSPQHTGISVIGRSLGSGVATLLASTRKIDKMVLITPYDSIRNIAQDQYPMFPIDYLLLDKFDSVSRIKSIDSSTLIIIAELDSIIPSKYSDRLIDEFPAAQVSVNVIRGAGHNDLSYRDSYYELLHNFM
ncbi:MAG: alpha/beta hydrolase [Pseudomonadales bacterium]